MVLIGFNLFCDLRASAALAGAGQSCGVFRLQAALLVAVGYLLGTKNTRLHIWNRVCHQAKIGYSKISKTGLPSQ